MHIIVSIINPNVLLNNKPKIISSQKVLILLKKTKQRFCNNRYIEMVINCMNQPDKMNTGTNYSPVASCISFQIICSECLRLCVKRLDDWVKVLLQISHLNGFSRLWTARPDDFMNNLSHLNLFSPVCVRMW